MYQTKWPIPKLDWLWEILWTHEGTRMKSKASFLVFLVLAVGMPVYAANFEVSANLNSLDIVVEKSADGQVHIIKNFDEAYFEYSENISGKGLDAGICRKF